MNNDLNVNDLQKDLDDSKSINQLSRSFDNINKAMESSSSEIAKLVANYKISTYLYQEYILMNKSKNEIARDLSVSPGKIQYYINKYNLKKTPEAIKECRIRNQQKTWDELYGEGNHPMKIEAIKNKAIETKQNNIDNGITKPKRYVTKATRRKMSIGRKKAWKRQKANQY